MAAHVIVDAARDRPLRAGTFDGLGIFYSYLWRIQVSPPIPAASKNGYVGSKGPVVQRESRAAKGRLLMLGVEPPLDRASELKAKQMLCLEESSQLVSEDYGGKVAEIRGEIDGKGSVNRKIRFPTECGNDLSRGAARCGQKQERHGGPQER